MNSCNKGSWAWGDSFRAGDQTGATRAHPCPDISPEGGVKTSALKLAPKVSSPASPPAQETRYSPHPHGAGGEMPSNSGYDEGKVPEPRHHTEIPDLSTVMRKAFLNKSCFEVIETHHNSGLGTEVCRE